MFDISLNHFPGESWYLVSINAPGTQEQPGDVTTAVFAYGPEFEYATRGAAFEAASQFALGAKTAARFICNRIQVNDNLGGLLREKLAIQKEESSNGN